MVLVMMLLRSVGRKLRIGGRESVGLVRSRPNGAAAAAGRVQNLDVDGRPTRSDAIFVFFLEFREREGIAAALSGCRIVRSGAQRCSRRAAPRIMNSDV